MPVENFVPTAVIAEAPSTSPAFGSGNALDVPANALVEDGTVGTVNLLGASTMLSYLFSNFVLEGGSTPLSTRINATATINALSVEVKSARDSGLLSGSLVAWLKNNDLTSTSSGIASIIAIGTVAWASIQNGVVFGNTTLADVRSANFGVYHALSKIGTGFYFLDAVRIVVDYTNGSTSSRPRRQIIRLPDGRIAAARARIR